MRCTMGPHLADTSMNGCLGDSGCTPVIVLNFLCISFYGGVQPDVVNNLLPT